jgi:hypothetical protein
VRASSEAYEIHASSENYLAFGHVFLCRECLLTFRLIYDTLFKKVVFVSQSLIQ